jgi:ferric iron reductase protein FhuF
MDWAERSTVPSGFVSDAKAGGSQLLTNAPPADICREIDDLANSHEGTACFAGMLVGRDDPRPTVGADALLDDGLRARIHARFSQRFDAFEERATHSIWMKWYLNTFLPPVLLTDVLLARMLPVALDQMRFILSDDGRVSAVQIDGTSIDSTGTDPFTRFAPLIFDHFEPLITMWSARTDVTRRVYWSNVGNTFEAMLRRIESTAGMTLRLREAQRLLEEPMWPDGRINPLAGAVTYENDIRLRRICCLQYMLPDRRFCKACPIEEAQVLHHGTSTACQ